MGWSLICGRISNCVHRLSVSHHRSNQKKMNGWSIEVHALIPFSASTDAMAKLQAVDGHPEGYPQLAAFFGCDPRKFLMCRSFMYSRIRHLLYCQDELAQLQQGLIDQDDEDASTSDGRRVLASRKRYEFRNKTRNALIKKIGPKLKEYGKRCWLLSI